MIHGLLSVCLKLAARQQNWPAKEALLQHDWLNDTSRNCPLEEYSAYDSLRSTTDVGTVKVCLILIRSFG